MVERVGLWACKLHKKFRSPAILYFFPWIIVKSQVTDMPFQAGNKSTIKVEEGKLVLVLPGTSMDNSHMERFNEVRLDVPVFPS